MYLVILLFGFLLSILYRGCCVIFLLYSFESVKYGYIGNCATPDEIISTALYTAERFNAFCDEKKKSEEKREEVDEKEKKHLKALGFDSLPSIIELSQRYRTLCRKFHPDTISSLGLDQEYIEFASKRFQEIHEAYIYLLDRIKK